MVVTAAESAPHIVVCLVFKAHVANTSGDEQRQH